MNAIPRTVAALAILATAVGCGFGARKTVSYDYTPYVTSDPRSVLVAPMAGFEKDQQLYLSTVAQPLAERGYYVMPVRLTQELLAEQGYQERALELRRAWRTAEESMWTLVDPATQPGVRDLAVELADLTGADSVLFVFVYAWYHKLDTSEGFLSNWVDQKMNHEIDLDYLLVGAGGDTLWRARKRVQFTHGGGSLLKEIWNARKKPSHERIDAIVARDVNRLMIEARTTQNEMTGSWFHGFPMLVGPYHPGYDADRARRRPPATPPASGAR